MAKTKIVFNEESKSLPLMVYRLETPMKADGGVNSSSTETGLGCCNNGCSSPFSSLPSSSAPLPVPATLLFTTSIIFFSAFKSSSHFSSAPNSLLLFSATSKSEVAIGGLSPSPISLATRAGGARERSGDFRDFERLISAGNVGLLGTVSHENLVESLFSCCNEVEVEDDDEEEKGGGGCDGDDAGFCFDFVVGEETPFFSFFFPGKLRKIIQL